MGMTSRKKIYLHGNNKSIAELELAIDAGCKIIVDNWLELETLAQLTAKKRTISENFNSFNPRYRMSYP